VVSRVPASRFSACRVSTRPNSLHSTFWRTRNFEKVYTSGISRQRNTPEWLTLDPGIKEYSDWPTIPQLYVDKEFVGGCDILMSMHQDGTLADLLEQKKVLVPADEPEK
jgi:hypothetical protein